MVIHCSLVGECGGGSDARLAQRLSEFCPATGRATNRQAKENEEIQKRGEFCDRKMFLRHVTLDRSAID
jgi:hypothetical protein